MRTVKEALEDGSLSLEDEIDYADMTEEDYKKEIERLSNIINELEKWVEEKFKIKDTQYYYVIDANDLKRKLQELKGSNSNE